MQQSWWAEFSDLDVRQAFLLLLGEIQRALQMRVIYLKIFSGNFDLLFQRNNFSNSQFKYMKQNLKTVQIKSTH